MGKHNLDRLFEEKLANNEVAPSQQAWDVLSEGLDKKRRINIWGWLSIAASAALLLTSAYLLVQPNSTELSDSYVSSNTDIAPDVPDFEAQLPVFIRHQTPAVVGSIVSLQDAKSVKQTESVLVAETTQIVEDEMTNIENQKKDSHLGPILDSDLIKMSPVLVVEHTDDPSLVQSKADDQPAVLASTEQINQPVTIIYKQGEVEEKSNISKALNFMDEVRKGEKKLLDMKKIKTNLFAKNKEEVNNSK